MFSQPGWKSGSYGYHGDEGKLFVSSGFGVPYGPKFFKGDVVGCGVEYGSLYFTKNGKHLGAAVNVDGNKI